MKHKDGKVLPLYDKNSRIVLMAFMCVVLCGFSFYLGRLFCSVNDNYEVDNIMRVGDASQEMLSGTPNLKSMVFPECDIAYQDYTPCTDPKRWKRYDIRRLTFMERHCPPRIERKQCLVPPPDGYKTPIRWPKSKNECWYRNVPYDWISVARFAGRPMEPRTSSCVPERDTVTTQFAPERVQFVTSGDPSERQRIMSSYIFKRKI